MLRCPGGPLSLAEVLIIGLIMNEGSSIGDKYVSFVYIAFANLCVYIFDLHLPIGCPLKFPSLVTLKRPRQFMTRHRVHDGTLMKYFLI